MRKKVVKSKMERIKRMSDKKNGTWKVKGRKEENEKKIRSKS